MFNERMTDYIEGNFKSCLKGGEGFVPVYYPHIQKKMKEKVLKNFVELESEDETILMIYDTSLFNRCKNGMVITDKAIYYKEILDDTLVCSFSNWRPDRDETEKILNISKENAFFLAPFLDKFLTEICTIKKYDGLFEAEKFGSIEIKSSACDEEKIEEKAETDEKLEKEVQLLKK